MARAQLGRPIPIDRGTPIAWRGDQCPERGARRRTDLDRAAPVVAQFTWDIADAHEPSITEHGGRAVGELEIETAADGQHDARVAQHGPAHGSHHRGMRVGNQPAAFTGVEVDGLQLVEQLNKLRSAPLAPRPEITSTRFADHKTSTARSTEVGSGRMSARGLASMCSASCRAFGISDRKVSVGKSR